MDQNLIEHGYVYCFVRRRYHPPQADFKKGRHSCARFSYKQVILKDPCVYCGGKAQGRDHIQARIRGGRNAWINRAPACSKCDRAKSEKSVLLFMIIDKSRKQREEKNLRKLYAKYKRTVSYSDC